MSNTENINASDNGKWYIIKCPSGTENKFITDLKEILEKLKISESLIECFIPQVNVERKTGKKSVMANYIFIKIISDPMFDTAISRIKYASFLLSPTLEKVEVDIEMIENLKKNKEIEEEKKQVKEQVGDLVVILEHPFKDFKGRIDKIEKDTVTVVISILGSDHPVELPFSSIKRIDN